MADDDTPRRRESDFQGVVTPRPDPTELTTDQLRREIGALREVIETRLKGMDRAIELLQVDLDRRPAETDVKVSHLKELVEGEIKSIGSEFSERLKTVDQQFKGVENQFLERDVRVKDSAAAATTAVNAALQAAKEAVGEQNKSFTLSIDKSEKSTLEQINQQRILLQTNYGALNDKITAIDTRLTRFEGLGLGTAAAQTVQREDRTAHVTGERFNMTTAISLVALAIVLIVDILARAVPVVAP